MPRIEVTFSPKGDATVKTFGFVGRACKLASAFLLKALGQAGPEHNTAEFYQTETTPTHNEVSQ